MKSWKWSYKLRHLVPDHYRDGQKFKNSDQPIKKASMQVQFALWWNNLNSHVKSVIIATGGVILALLLFKLAQWALPGFDFTSTEYLLGAGIGTFIVHLVTSQASS